MIAKLNRAVCLMGFLSLVGCTVGPKYKPPTINVPGAFKEPPPSAFKEQGQWKPGEPKDDTIRGKWWELFSDPVLNGLEEQVNINNQNVAQAEANFRQARAAIRAARSGYFPTIAVNPGITESKQSANSAVSVAGAGVSTTVAGTSGSGGTTTVTSGTGTTTVNGGSGRRFTNFQIPFDLSYTVDAWGRIRHLVESNVDLAQASAADLETARLSAHSELAIDYYELRGSDLKKNLLDQTIADYQKQLTLTQQRFDQGIATQLEIEQARTLLETARAQSIDLGVLRAQYEHAIAVLTGQPPSSLTIAPNNTPLKPPVVPVALPAELLERRPDIAAAERRTASQNEQIGVAIAAFYPAITLSASAGLGSSSLTNLFSWPSRLWSVGPALAQTLFDGGYRRAVTQQAQAAFDANAAVYRQTILSAFQGVEDNLSALRILSDEVTQQQNVIGSAERTLNIANIRYTNGVDTYLDVITAENTLLSSRSSVVDIVTREMTASVALVQALGGGWSVSQLPKAPDLTH